MLARSFIGAAAVAVVVFACTNDKKQSTPEEDITAQLSDEDREKVAQYAAEVEIGRNMAGRLAAFYGIADEPDLTAYLNRVGLYVARYSNDPDRRYMFQVLDSDAINAYAVPGGYIFLTRGTIALLRNEAELAAVLGHEVNHVAERHMVNQLIKMGEEERKKKAEDLQQSPLPEEIAVRERVAPTETTAFGKLAARYLSGSSLGALNVLQAARAGMTVIMKEGLQHEDEFQADRQGMAQAIDAGYDPRAMIVFLRRMAASNPDAYKVLSKTHPSPNKRIAMLCDVGDELDIDEITGARGPKRFNTGTAAIKKNETANVPPNTKWRPICRQAKAAVAKSDETAKASDKNKPKKRKIKVRAAKKKKSGDE